MRNLQPYRHDCFSKISRTLFDFLNNTYWVSLFQRNSLLIFWTGVSCFSVALSYSTLFCCGGKANLVWFTLFYSTLLTLTHGQNDRQRNEYTRFAWAGGTFFPVVLLCCVSVWFWREKGFDVHMHVLLRVQYSCGGVLVIWFWSEIDFGVTHIISVQYSCAVVSVFLLQREIVLKMRICLYDKILLGYLIMIRQPKC